MLAGEVRPGRRGADAGLAVAGGADGGLLLAGAAPRRPHRPVCGSPWLGEKRRDVLHVLVRERRCLRLHGLVGAGLRAILLQRDHDVFGLLAAELRHAVGRIGVAVAGDAVAAHAGRRQLRALRRVARGLGAGGHQMPARTISAAVRTLRRFIGEILGPCGRTGLRPSRSGGMLVCVPREFQPENPMRRASPDRDSHAREDHALS